MVGIVGMVMTLSLLESAWRKCRKAHSTSRVRLHSKWQMQGVCKCDCKSLLTVPRHLFQFYFIALHRTYCTVSPLLLRLLHNAILLVDCIAVTTCGIAIRYSRWWMRKIIFVNLCRFDSIIQFWPEMYFSIYIYVYIYMCVCVRICIHWCIFIHIYTHVCVYTMLAHIYNNVIYVCKEIHLANLSIMN